MRAVRDVHVTRDAARVDEVHRTFLEELVEMSEDRPRIWRDVARPAGSLLHPAECCGDDVGMRLERIGGESSRHTTQIWPEVISECHAKGFVAAHPNRRPGARSVEAI